eukprot:gene5665-6361_t
MCMNTKELFAEIERVNTEGLGDKVIIGSTDVMALYLSLDIDFNIQMKGKAIGFELTGNVAQLFMMLWDRMFTSRLSELGIIERLCKRYVDDINMAINKLPTGTRFADGRLFVDEMAIEGGTKKIVHKFYVKAVSTKAVVNADSALPMRQKRTVLTQEVLRVLLNCSIYVSWEEIAQNISSMVLQMQCSGFSKNLRFEIVTSALKAYDKIHRKVEGGEHPLYHLYEWNREERSSLLILIKPR